MKTDFLLRNIPIEVITEAENLKTEYKKGKGNTKDHYVADYLLKWLLIGFKQSQKKSK
jgi:hypothetical protein